MRGIRMRGYHDAGYKDAGHKDARHDDAVVHRLSTAIQSVYKLSRGIK